MRETVGTTWTFGLITTFILLFTMFLILTISYTRAYKIKNETLSIMEKYEGYTADSREIINNYLSYSGYNETGKCPDGYYGEDSLSNTGSNISLAESNKNYYYCIKQIKSNNNKVYYQLQLFYRFNLPIIGQIKNFNVTGSTITVNATKSIINSST